jgi:hypothetical protein
VPSTYSRLKQRLTIDTAGIGPNPVILDDFPVDSCIGLGLVLNGMLIASYVAG